MSRWNLAAAVLTGGVALVLTATTTVAQQSQMVNRGVVELETSTSAGISVRIAEDLANLIDDGATRRVVPVVGKGSLQNLLDLKYLHGIDMAILSTDVLDYAREQRLFPGIENSITYITKLYPEEFHLLARADIKTVADLANKKVNIDLQGSSTAITAGRLFGLLKIPIVATNDPPEIALAKLRRGEISALALLAGKPAPLFLGLQSNEDLHLIGAPFNQLAASAYLPTRLTATDYPDLIPSDHPVETVAVATALLAAELRQLPERYKNVANFVDMFFTGFQSLLAPGHHPKWQEVDLAAELPGWRRFAPAEQWLQRNMQVAHTPNPDELRAMFSRFVDERRQVSGGAPMTPQEKDALFQQFQSWQKGQAQ